MEYDVNLLAEAYLSFLADTEIEIKTDEMPSYDKLAYTDNEYVSLINELLTDFDNADDLALTEQFLTKK